LRRQGKNSLRVLGIDPGSRSCGYGVISSDGDYVTSGRIVPDAKSPLHVRVREIHDGLAEVIEEYGPAEAVVEKVFFAKSARAALILGHARGVALLAAAAGGLGVYEYSALEVKKAVTGYGRAEKSQVQEMVKRLLSLKISLSPDSSDALAIALCHLNRLRLRKEAAAS
jgi:crossover junction endodeoxyribonuclease RuvC